MPDIRELQKLMATPEPPELGPGPRAGVQPQSQLTMTLDGLLNRVPFRIDGGAAPASASNSKQNQQLIRALILLWHDHLDPAHTIAQEITNADGAFVHAIMHRREPDYGNAKYWFRRVGTHVALAEMTTRAGALLASKNGDSLRQKLLPEGLWDSCAFVDACEQASRQPRSEQAKLLRELQALESGVLLEHFCK